MSKNDDSIEADSEHDTTDLEVSRRKFLKWASYVPPAILSVLSSSTPAEAATCNPALCGPNDDSSCGPDTGCTPDF